MLDYILVSQHDLEDVVHTRVMPRVECHTDHRIVRCKLSFHFKLKPRLGCAPKKKLKVCSLQTVKIRVDLQENIRSKLERSNCQTNSLPDVLWDHVKIAILQVSNELTDSTQTIKKQ